VTGEFGGAGSGRTHLGREVLGNVKNFHASLGVEIWVRIKRLSHKGRKGIAG
jgi:hypothetical protein